MTTTSRVSTIRAGIPQNNSALFLATRFSVGDPVALLEIVDSSFEKVTIFIVRDIEMDRARDATTVDQIACPADFAPKAGLSPDREVATAQAAAECLRRHGVSDVTADRTLPLSFTHILRKAGIAVTCDLEMGILERRQKSEQQVEMLRFSQSITEKAIQLACRMVAHSEAHDGGALYHDGTPLTSERVRSAANVFLMEQGFTGPTYIIAGGPQGADCHNPGSGQLFTGQPVIVDIFPTNMATHYCGDCTRTVVHGDIPDELLKMNLAVRLAKKAGCEALRPGVTGKEVHAATTAILLEHGYHVGFPPEGADDTYCTMHHGTGHGIGLEVHEPPLLDPSGIPLIKGDALTVEPGLYQKNLGGIRVEDMVVVTEDGFINLNQLPEGLDWKA
mgnify:CR=1 FL=1|tara:strand:+ start:423 stop:1592 length:1170 start_codon:yes stop_codon:yes gene_type:complete